MIRSMVEPASTSDRRRRRLLHRIHQRYPTVTEELRFGEVSIPFTRVANPDQVLDDLVAEIDRQEKISGERVLDPPHLPYWAELWDSAGGIAAALVRMNVGESTRVLDLGCGMGLAGAVAAALGAKVLLADLESPALLFARLNCLSFRGRVRTMRLNWQTDRLGERFDLILGADIVYERKQWESLNEFWMAHLAPGGRVLLGEPGRQSGEMFLPWIGGKGWGVDVGTARVSAQSRSIRIISLRRS